MSAEHAEPCVTVVVATRNRWRWLCQCVQSVRAQEGVSWELVVVDDCSSDESASRLEELEGDGVQVYRQQEPQERCAARNRGLNLARGRFVMFLDDDDRLWPGALSALVAALEGNEDAVASVGARWVVFTGEDYERRDAHPRRLLKMDILDELLFGWSAVSGQNLYRTSIVRSFGGYEDQSLIPCEDRMLWMRAASLGPVVLIPDTVMSYRYHAGQQRPSNIIEIRDEVAERIINDSPADAKKRLRRLRRSGRLIEQSEETMSYGNPFGAAWTSLRAFSASPGIFFSPLIGEWVIRRLGGRLYRRFIPAKTGKFSND